MGALPDIDIDVADRVRALEGHRCSPCSLLRGGRLKRHPTGVCYQSLPTDPVTGAIGFPSVGDLGDVLGDLGFHKIDVIPSHAYAGVRDRAHMRALLSSVDWDLLSRPDVVARLQQLGGHADMVAAYSPRSIEDLACMVAVIRPGKRWLIGHPIETVRERVWEAEGDGYRFKKSHAFAYAMAIAVQMMSLAEAGTLK